MVEARDGTDRVIVFHDASAKAKEAYKRFVQQCQAKDVKTDEVEVGDADFLEATRQILSTLRKRASGDSVMCLDGGTRVLSNAALLACVLHGTRVSYRHARDGKLVPVPLLTTPYHAILRDKPRSVLRYIRAHPGCTAVDAARQLKLSKPTISHHVRRLLELGLIERRRDTQDQRRAILRAVPTIGLLFDGESDGRRAHEAPTVRP